MSRESLLSAVWRQNRLLPLLILGLLLGNLAVYVLLSVVVWPQQAEREREFIALQNRVRAERHDLPSSPQELFRQAQSDLERFRAAIPERSEFPALIDEVAELAREAGVKVGPIGYQPKELDEEQLLAYTLQFSVSGDYRAVKHFLQTLENLPRLLECESLAASATATVDNAEQVALALRLITYFRSDQP